MYTEIKPIIRIIAGLAFQSPANSPTGPVTLQPSDTAYPRFKSRPTDVELKRFYTPTESERLFFEEATRSAGARLGFAVLLKTFQRLGYFVPSSAVPEAIVEHIASALGEALDRDVLGHYDSSHARHKHLRAVRAFLGVKSFDADAKVLLLQAFNDAALTKEDLADIINVGIEVLVRHRFELPAFDTLLRQARTRRAATHQDLFAQINQALGESGGALSMYCSSSAMTPAGSAPGTTSSKTPPGPQFTARASCSSVTTI